MGLFSFGDDGFGSSDTKGDELRNFFEISSEHLVINSLRMLGKIVMLINLLEE